MTPSGLRFTSQSACLLRPKGPLRTRGAMLHQLDGGAQKSVEPALRPAYDDVMRSMPSQEEMRRACSGRDASYDGVFFLAVCTTGIFCRPSCPARTPKPENSEYFASASEALHAGFRPCKRCRPMDTNGRPPQWVEQLLAKVDADPAARITDLNLRSLAVDPARARRYFNKHYGMTFQAYARTRRMGEALSRIRRGADLTHTALDHGYGSNSGFREAFSRTFGRPPGKSRNADCIVTRTLESPIGPLLVCAAPSGICALEFRDRRALGIQVSSISRRFESAVVPGTNQHLDHLARQLDRYFAGQLRAFDVPLVLRGTPFQEAVWSQLLRIPYGQTRSYEQLARDAKRPGAQRAVGTANGRNPVAIVIPCHRVVNKSGRLGGYGGGLWRKQFLLDLEKSA